MPRGDRTGPGGLGPMTGRGLGFCAGYDTPGYTKGPGMGLGRGWGRGYGGYGRGLAWRRGGGRGYGGYGGYGAYGGYGGYSAPVYAPVMGAPPAYIPSATPETQVSMLKQEKQYLESEIENIKGALDDISKKLLELEKTE